jgi:starch synthase
VSHFSSADLRGKRSCKRALLGEFGFPVGDDALDRPLVAVLSRLVDQKGLDLIAATATELVKLDATWIVVGRGDTHYETFLQELAARHPTRVGVHIGFSEALSHRVTAGADLLLMPSRFEPCGLGQMYGLRYGTVPVVNPVGGLEDTIQRYTRRAKGANGFKLEAMTPEGLIRTLRQALRIYRDKAAWRPLMERGMTANLSWENAAGEYVKVYRQARDIAAIRGGL